MRIKKCQSQAISNNTKNTVHSVWVEWNEAKDESQESPQKTVSQGRPARRRRIDREKFLPRTKNEATPPWLGVPSVPVLTLLSIFGLVAASPG